MEFDKKKIEELLKELKDNKGMEDKVTQELMGYVHKMSIKELTEFYKSILESRAIHMEFMSKFLEMYNKNKDTKKDLEDE